MKPKTIKKAVIPFAVLSLAATSAFAAVPDNTVVIGSKAFTTSYFINDATNDELNSAIETNESKKIYFNINGVTDGFADLFNPEVSATEEELASWPQIELKDANGTRVFAPGNGEEITEEQPPVEEGDLVVESVSSITTTGVTLSFEALEEDKLAAELTVVDPNGNEVAVKAQDLSAGETEAVFIFEKAYANFEAIPSGVWKINGTEYDFGAQVAVKAVKEAKNQVELLAALQSDYFTGVNEDLIGEYEGKFGDAATVADVQEVIDEVNKEHADKKDEAAVVKAVVDSKTQPQLLAALNANFERVNADWIVAYANTDVQGTKLIDLDGKNDYPKVTIESIQGIIDDANKAAIDTVPTGVLNKAEAELSTASITKAENLINAYIKPDTKDPLVTTKADLLDRVAVHKAVIAVNEASTNNILKTRLAALATIVNDATTFDIKKVNDVLLPEYRDAIADPTTVSKTAEDKLTAKKLEGIIDAVNEAELKAAVSAVETNFPNYNETNTAHQTAALKELNRLADISVDVDAKDIDANYIEKYITNIAKDLANTTPTITGTDAEKAEAIQQIIEDANGGIVTSAVGTVKNNASTNATDLLAALKDANLGLTNVKDANKDAYFTAAVNKSGDKYFEKIEDKEDAQKVVNAVNAYVDANKATSATDLRTALTTFAVALDSIGGVNEAIDFIDLSNAAKLEVAEIVLNAKEANFTTAYTLGQAVDAAMTKHSVFLKAVNTADSISAMNSALNNKDVFPAYHALDAEDKVVKAELVFNKLTELKELETPSEFKTIAEIKAAAGL